MIADCATRPTTTFEFTHYYVTHYDLKLYLYLSHASFASSAADQVAYIPSSPSRALCLVVASEKHIWGQKAPIKITAAVTLSSIKPTQALGPSSFVQFRGSVVQPTSLFSYLISFASGAITGLKRKGHPRGLISQFPPPCMSSSMTVHLLSRSTITTYLHLHTRPLPPPRLVKG